MTEELTKETRSATEVLLALEHRQEQVEGLLLSVDTNVKMILNKLNLLQQTKSVLQPTVMSERMFPEVVKVVASPPPEPGLLSTIEQQVLYKSDQRPIIVADVQVFDTLTNSKVAKVLTSGAGKWHTALPAGKYRVEIKKGPTAGHQGLIHKFDMEVVEGGAPMPLDRKLL